jgi:hypothetical protein
MVFRETDLTTGQTIQITPVSVTVTQPRTTHPEPTPTPTPLPTPTIIRTTIPKITTPTVKIGTTTFTKDTTGAINVVSSLAPKPVVTIPSQTTVSLEPAKATQIAPGVADLLGKTMGGQKVLTALESKGITVAPSHKEYVPESPYQKKQDYSPYQKEPIQQQTYDETIIALKDQAVATSSQISDIRSGITQIKSSPSDSQWTITYYINDKPIRRTVSRSEAITYYEKQLGDLQEQKKVIGENLYYVEQYKGKGYRILPSDKGFTFELPKASEVIISKYGTELAKTQLTSASFIESPLGIKTYVTAYQELGAQLLGMKGSEKIGQTRLEELSQYALGLEEAIQSDTYASKILTSPAVLEGVVTPGLLLVGGGILSAGASRLAPAISSYMGKVGGTGAKILSGAKAVGTELSPYVGRVTGSPIGKGLMKYGMFGAFEGKNIAETAITRPEALGGVLGESLFGWETSWSAMEGGIKGSDYAKGKWVEKDIQKTEGFPELKQAKEAEGYGITQIQPMKQGEAYFKSDVLIKQEGAPDITAQAYGVGTSDIPGVTVTKGKAIYSWEQPRGLTKIEKIRIREIPGESIEVAKYGDVTITSEVGQVTRPEVDTRIASLIKREDLLTPSELYKRGLKSGGIYKMSGKMVEKGEGQTLYGAWFPHSGGGMYLRPLQPRTPLGSQFRSVIAGRGDPAIIKGLSPKGWLDATFVVPEKGEVIRHELIHGYQFDVAGFEKSPIQKIGETTEAFEERFAIWESHMEARTRNLASETMYFTPTGEPITYAEFQSGLPRIDEPTMVEGITKTQKILETKEGRIDLSESVSDYKNVLSDISGKQKTTSLVFTSKKEPQLTVSIRKPEAVPYPLPEQEQDLLLYVGKEGNVEVGVKYTGFMTKAEEDSFIVSYGEKTGTRSKIKVIEKPGGEEILIPKGYKSKYEPKYEVFDIGKKPGTPGIQKATKYSGYMTKAEEDSLLMTYGEKTGTRTKPLIEKPVKAGGYTTKAEEDSLLVSYGEKTGTRTKQPVPKRTTYLDFNEPGARRTEEIIFQKEPERIPTGGLVNTSGVESRITSGGLALYEEGRVVEKAVLGEAVSILGTGLLAGGTRQILSPITKPEKDKYSIGVLGIKTETGLEEEGAKRVGGTLITPITDTGFDYDRDFNTGLRYDQGTDTIQEQKQEVIPVQETINEIQPITETIRVTTPVTPTTITPWIPFIPTRKKDEEPKDYFTKSPVAENEGYNVFVKERSMYGGKIRKQTKFFKANKQPLNYTDALSLGGDITDNTSAVSFRLKKTKGEPMKLDRRVTDFGQRSYKFRKQGETFIEKPEYRMDTPGELQQVSALGQEARRTGAFYSNTRGHKKHSKYDSDLLFVGTPKNRSTHKLSRTTKIKSTGFFNKKKGGRNNAYY